MEIVFFGNERLATGVSTKLSTLKALVSAGYKVVAIVSNYQPATSRQKRPLEIENFANEHGIKLLLPRRLKDITPELVSYRAKAGVLVAYGKIVPPEVIASFPAGIINIHPSLLPKHRGPTPIESVILNGDDETGVSVMQLSKDMDSGPLYAQSRLKLAGNESKQELADKLLQDGADLLIKELPAILDGHMSPIPQDDSQTSYDSLISKQDSWIDWHKPALRLEREIRAYAVWPGSRTTLAGKEVVVTKAHIEESREPFDPAQGKQTAESRQPGEMLVESKHLAVQTADGILVIDKLKPAGKQEMTAQAFLLGYGNLFK